jgi:hypothetical protein
MRLWRRAATPGTMHASRFAAWRALETRADALASYGALCLALVGSLAALSLI